MTPLQVYLILLVTKISEGLAPFVIGVGILGIFFAISAYNDVTPSTAHKWVRNSVLILLTGILFALLPTKKDLAIIYGVSYVSNNEQIKKLPDNVLNVVNTWLEETKTELSQ